MNGQAAKFERKELRRAIGAQAVEDLASLSRYVHEHHAAIHQLQDASATDHGDIAKLDGLITVMESHLETQRRDLEVFTRRSFWRRLQWLLTGH